MIKNETINAGKWNKKFTGLLNSDVCDRYNNAEITVISKLYLKQGNPSGGVARGTANDSDGNSQDVWKWTPSAWRAWTKQMVNVCSAYSGKFWLINNDKWGAFVDRGVTYYPNIWCRHLIELVNSDVNAHHTITVYRVPKSGRNFRSDFELMDSYDTQLQHKDTDSRGKKLMQRPAVHEYFHTLGVRHIDHGEANCPAADSGNASTCYGNTDADQKTLMGNGMGLHPKFADPWRRAAVKLTGAGTVASATSWKAELLRHYPRTLAEVNRKAKIKRRPNRE